ncbi:MAG: SDR family oxidoreductase [Candidatus Marinimicrobia bacterium]|nr:SDR family oxidoreductase [Candidatus Neomarinimicrobiota bacterium]
MLRVFITGANRGIGLGLAGQCLQRGDRVFAGCRNPEQATELHRLQDQHGDRLTVLPLDVTDQSAIDSAVTTVEGFVDGLDLLVNNAGVGGGEDPFGQLAEEGLIDTFRVNAVAPILLAQAMLPLLKKGQRPVIASVTSRMGSIADNGSGGYYAYRASKAALNMLHKSLAVDLAQQGIITVVLHPGWVRTDMGGQGGRLSVEESVAGLLQVVDGLTETDSGRFFDWRGKKVPW